MENNNNDTDNLIINSPEINANNSNKCDKHNSKDDNINVIKCSICIENILDKDKHITKCEHTFHKECIDKWLESNNKCPYCRTELTDINSSPVIHDPWNDLLIYARNYNFHFYGDMNGNNAYRS